MSLACAPAVSPVGVFPVGSFSCRIFYPAREGRSNTLSTTRHISSRLGPRAAFYTRERNSYGNVLFSRRYHK